MPPPDAPRGSPALSHLLLSLFESTHRSRPFDHWRTEDMLTDALIDAVTALPVQPPGDALFDGRRESNNAARRYFNPPMQRDFAVCRELVAMFAHPALRSALSLITGAPLREGRLRIEYCQDVDGFWLEPHLDLGVKLITMLIYLSDDPALADAGTDLYDDTPAHALVDRVPYRRNAGLIFIPGETTWHGFSPRPIHGLRRSLIINYVTPAWRAVEELA